jgi:hypothetical protein
MKSLRFIILILISIHAKAADAPRLFEHFIRFTNEGLISNQLVPIEIKLNEGESLYAIKTTPSNSAKCLSMKDTSRVNIFYLKCSNQSTVSLQVTVQSRDSFFSFTIQGLQVKNPTFRSPSDRETVIDPPQPVDLPSQAARGGRVLWMDNGCVACHALNVISQSTWYGSTQNASANNGKGDGVRNQFQRVTQMSQFLTLTDAQVAKIATYLNERHKNFNQ